MGVELYTVASRFSDPVPPQPRTDPFLLRGSTTLQEFSPDGSAVYVHAVEKGIVKLDLASTISSTGEPFLASTANVQMMDVSPSGAYLLTWERWYEKACPNNLKVWQASTGKLLAAFPQRTLKRSAWPYLQWSHDEQHAFLLSGTAEVRIYSAADIVAAESDPGAVRFSQKLRIPGIASLSLPQTHSKESIGVYYFTSFCPGSKDKPAKASLHAFRLKDENYSLSPFPALLSKSLFQAEEMNTHWSAQNDAAIITLQTSVDTSGKSYYGSAQIFMLHSLQKDVISVPLPNHDGGPVLAVQWMPNPQKNPSFIVIAGRVPSMTSLHHGQTGEPLFQFGKAHRNTVCFSPHGRFICVGGFGNMAGGISFWDINKQKPVVSAGVNSLNAQGTLRSEATIGYGWSPDSRLFSVSTTTPRMNVDNGVKVFTYGGAECSNTPWDNNKYRPDKLLQASFVPVNLQVVPNNVSYPDRPQSPPPAESAANVQFTSTAPKPAGRYIPPSARNRTGGGTSLAERMRLEKEQEQGASRITSANRKTVSSTGRTVVGLAPVEPEKSKSAIRREKAKLKQQQLKLQQEAATAVAPTPEPASVDPEKRARKLKKTLKQIEELKAKPTGELNEDQRNKLASESELRKELESLGV